jgi:hypothetical protein
VHVSLIHRRADLIRIRPHFDPSASRSALPRPVRGFPSEAGFAAAWAPLFLRDEGHRAHILEQCELSVPYPRPERSGGAGSLAPGRGAPCGADPSGLGRSSRNTVSRRPAALSAATTCFALGSPPDPA